MGLCPADMSGIHAPDEGGVCLNCDAECPCVPDAPAHAHLAGGYADDRCSVCGWPIPTGDCGRCLNESLERSGGGTSQTRFILASMSSVPPLSDAEQDALIEWLNSTACVRKAMSAGVLADLYGVVASIAHLRCECKTTLEA